MAKYQYKFVRYEINYMQKKEYIYVDGEPYKERTIHGGFLGLFQSELLVEYFKNIGEMGWDLQTESGGGESRNFIFKKCLEESSNSNQPKYENLQLQEFKQKIDDLRNHIISYIRYQNQLFKYQNYLLDNKFLELKRIINASQDSLISKIGIDYSLLDKLLFTKNWKEADEITYTIIIKLLLQKDCNINKNDEGYKYINSDNILQIPYEDLLIINYLWIKHSQGHFGYSVQKQILQRLLLLNNIEKLNIVKTNESICDEFVRQIGWKKEGEYLRYRQLNFDLDAPEGHLPTIHVGWKQTDDINSWSRYVKFLSLRVF
jgi:hypothetical protein